MIFSIDTTGHIIIRDVPKGELRKLVKETVSGKPTSLEIKSPNFSRVVKKFFDKNVPDEAQMIVSDDNFHMSQDYNEPASKFFLDTLEEIASLKNLKKEDREYAARINGSVIIVTEGDRIVL